MPSHQYSRVEEPFLFRSKERDLSDAETDSSAVYERPPRSWLQRSTSPWIASTIFFAFTTVALFVHVLTAHSMYMPSRVGTFEAGFETDLGKYLIGDRDYNLRENMLC